MTTFRRARNVCFTINNPTDADKAKMIINEDITYLIFGEEVGEEGTPHFQGYCEFSKQFGLKKIKTLLGDRAHIEARKGSQKQAIDYCKKDGKFIELGELKEQGKRNDLTGLKHQVTEGKSQIEVISHCENFQQIRYVEKLFEYKPLSPEYKKREVYWFWGPTSTGKTKAAYDLVKERKQDFWVSTLSGSQWFNGYWGQPIAILDEVRAKDYPYGGMLRILDGYEVRMPYKGGFCIWNPDVVIITSPVKPEDCYNGQMEYNDGGIEQLLRRITEVREFKKEPEVPSMFTGEMYEGDNIEHPERWPEDMSPRKKRRLLNGDE